MCLNFIPMPLSGNEIPTKLRWNEIPTNHSSELYTICNPAPRTISLALFLGGEVSGYPRVTWNYITENKIRCSDGQGHLAFLYLVSKTVLNESSKHWNYAPLVTSLVENTYDVGRQCNSSDGVVSEQGKFKILIEDVQAITGIAGLLTWTCRLMRRSKMKLFN